MKNKWASIAYVALPAGAISPISLLITEWGTASVTKQAIRVAISVIFMLMAIAIFYKYKLGAESRPNGQNTRLRAFFVKFPLLFAIFPMFIGVTVGVLLTVLFNRVLF